MEQLEGLKEMAERKREEIDLDPTREIETVTPSVMIQRFNGARPPFPTIDDSKTAIVCPEDSCHWQPCFECDPFPAKCRFRERHPIHLTQRNGIVEYKIRRTDDEGEVYYDWVAAFCECHPKNREDYKQNGS